MISLPFLPFIPCLLPPLFSHRAFVLFFFFYFVSQRYARLYLHCSRANNRIYGVLCTSSPLCLLVYFSGVPCDRGHGSICLRVSSAVAAAYRYILLASVIDHSVACNAHPHISNYIYYRTAERHRDSRYWTDSTDRFSISFSPPTLFIIKPKSNNSEDESHAPKCMHARGTLFFLLPTLWCARAWHLCENDNGLSSSVTVSPCGSRCPRPYVHFRITR